MIRLFFTALLIFTFIAYATGDVNTKKPLEIQDGIFIAATVVSQNFGVSIYYSPVSRVVIAKTDKISAKFIVQQKEAIVNGEFQEIKTPLILWENEVYFPVQVLTDVFGLAKDKLKPHMENPVKAQKVSATPTDRKDISRESSRIPIDVEKVETQKTKAKVTEEVKSENAEEGMPETIAESIPENDEEQTDESGTVEEDEQSESLPDESAVSEDSTETAENAPVEKKKILLWIDRTFLTQKFLQTKFDELEKKIQELSKNSETVELKVVSKKETEANALNSQEADFLVILTPGFLQNQNFQGISIFYRNDPEQKILQNISGKWSECLKKELGYEDRISCFPAMLKYYQYVKIPAVCIELFNLNNQEEQRWLTDDGQRLRLAKALLAGLEMNR
ncbi:MAG: stalk domain-containing protein [Candidatus Wallbacteria bacterium]|nr:stalk domain-containing protein [Candidatus Wallbacteria bacterium]